MRTGMHEFKGRLHVGYHESFLEFDPYCHKTVSLAATNCSGVRLSQNGRTAPFSFHSLSTLSWVIHNMNYFETFRKGIGAPAYIDVGSAPFHFSAFTFSTSMRRSSRTSLF